MDYKTVAEIIGVVVVIFVGYAKLKKVLEKNSKSNLTANEIKIEGDGNQEIGNTKSSCEGASNETKNKIKIDGNNNSNIGNTITQTHNGNGDNIAGDKVIN